MSKPKREAAERHFDAGIGERLRRLRLAQGLAQAELGRRIARSGPMVARAESGKSALSLYVLQRAADALGVNIMQILDDGEGSLDEWVATMLRRAGVDVDNDQTAVSENH